MSGVYSWMMYILNIIVVVMVVVMVIVVSLDLFQQLTATI